jgi:hypothetical protein
MRHAPGRASALLEIGTHAIVRFARVDALSDIADGLKRATCFEQRPRFRRQHAFGKSRSANHEQITKQKQNESKYREPDIAKRNTLSSRSRKNG